MILANGSFFGILPLGREVEGRSSCPRLRVGLRFSFGGEGGIAPGLKSGSESVSIDDNIGWQVDERSWTKIEVGFDKPSGTGAECTNGSVRT